MHNAIDLSQIIALGEDDPLYKEFFGDISWRVLPEDAMPEDKFVCDMKLDYLNPNMFPDCTVAHGYAYNDSRGVFYDGCPVRTSAIKGIYEKDGHTYIETRNTMYRLI